MATSTLRFEGTSLADLKAFPDGARQDTGYALHLLEQGDRPADTKPMRTVGPGAFEIRVSDDGRAFRTIVVAKFKGVLTVLHAFEKKTRRTARADIDLARQRYKTAAARASQRPLP